jgi:hypothetical protein
MFSDGEWIDHNNKNKYISIYMTCDRGLLLMFGYGSNLGWFYKTQSLGWKIILVMDIELNTKMKRNQIKAYF